MNSKQALKYNCNYLSMFGKYLDLGIKENSWGKKGVSYLGRAYQLPQGYT